MIRRSWRTALKNANSEKQVLVVVAGFLCEWSPGEISSLPAGAWPTELLASRAALLAHSNALCALHARFASDWTALPGLQELLLFFTHAAVRILRIEADARAPAAPALNE